MKYCPICNKEIRNQTIIDGKLINTQRRKYCYDCSPFGSGNNQLIKGNKSAQEIDEIKKNRKQYKNKQTAEWCRKNQKNNRNKRKSELIRVFGGECSKCGYNKCERALEFHHKDKTKKSFNISAFGYTCSWERLIK